MTKYAFIKELLKKQGKTQRELAAYLGIEPEKVNLSLTSGKREFQQNEIFPVADFLDLDREAFMLYVSGDTTEIPHKKEEKKQGSDSKKKDVIEIDVLNARACCGNGVEAFKEVVIGTYSMLPGDLKALTSTNPTQLKIIKTIGESMLPTIKPDEFVLVDLSYKTPSSDGLYVLCIGNDLMVKRIQINPIDNSVEIISDNPAYRSSFAKNYTEVRVVGRVIYHLKIDKIA
ncbi:MAG: hypothetical protein IJ752_06050 [Alphaproteobacteria bacterium]|nr:hypothetical protein [Alphaproteobacteria bacterium]